MSESSETPSPEKPRRITQFKPGQSGNPLGRPKRKVDMSVALNKALNDNILVTNLGIKQGKAFQTRPQPDAPHRCRRCAAGVQAGQRVGHSRRLLPGRERPGILGRPGDKGDQQ